MFSVDLEETFLRRMRDLIREQEYQCGKGIQDAWSYAGRVGEIRAYKKAIEVMRDIVKTSTTQEEADD